MEVKIIKPFQGDRTITQTFGQAFKWYLKIAGYPHNGIDFAMRVGVPIYACDDGKVSYADNVPDSDGLGINLEHKWGLSQYWHLSKLTAILGQRVKQGEVMGYSGRSGWATGPHLHFGIKIAEKPAKNMRGWSDPMKYFVEKVQDPMPPDNAHKVYIVKLNDNLWNISKKFYGTGVHWKRIYNANSGIIRDPNLIRPFQILRIP